MEVVKELNEKFPNPDEIVKEKDKKEFVKLFGEYLRIENILQNYDEFNHLKTLQTIDINNPEAVEEFKRLISYRMRTLQLCSKLNCSKNGQCRIIALLTMIFVIG